MKVRVLLWSALMIAATLPLRGNPAIEMRVTPNVCIAPAEVTVTVIIQADRANQAIRVEADSADFYRSSEMQLNGENAPRTMEFEFRGLPIGEFLVTATLFDAAGKPRAFIRQQVTVVSMGGN